MGSHEHAARTPAVAGQFYPGHPGRLAETVDRLLDESPSAFLEGEIVGVIAPHAGYSFSGPTAAAAYRALAGGKWQRVVVLAPSHRESFPFASLLDSPYETPLGVIAPDIEFIQRLIELDPLFRVSEAGHRSEHSLEVQLPFIQRVAPQASLIPIVLSDASPRALERIGLALAQAVSERPALLVASSDLYHGEDEAECRQADHATLAHILGADPARFIDALARDEVHACGAGPIGALLVAARALGADRAVLLAATNSSAVTGSTRGYVVGYAAIALLAGGRDRERDGREAGHAVPDATDSTPAADSARPGETGAEPAAGAFGPAAGPGGMGEQDRRELLRIAHAAMEAAVLGERPPAIRHVSGALAKPHAAFVTLRRHQQLRGCIGFAEALHPLARAVAELARAAALDDLRFKPVEREELPQISIEISVLTEPVLVREPEEIEAGQDGVVVSRGGHRGLLLPQVASEQGWDRWQLLEHCCLKAGLAGNAWKDRGTEIRRFQAEIFAEPEPDAGEPPRSGSGDGT